MSEQLFNTDEYENGHSNDSERQSQLAEQYRDWEPEFAPYKVQSHEFIVNDERVELVFGTLLDAYEHGRFPYDQDSTRLPHDPRHMPPSLERGSVDHAMFLWSTCYYMRGGERSVNAFIKLSRMYEAYPHLFSAETAACIEPEEVLEALKFARLGAHKIVPGQWVENARRMRERYDGDPRNIFKNGKDYDDALTAIKNDGRGGGFIGFQDKMVSMIVYYLMDEELIDSFNFPIPVDMHVTRVSVANRLIEFPDLPHKTNLYSPEVQAAIRKISFDYTERHDINPLRLCDAVWMLSEAICGSYPGNVTFEPLGRDNRDGRSTVLIPQEVDTSNLSQQNAYASSCLRCPVESTCEYAVPGKHTYVAGSLFIRGRRVRFPLNAQESLLE